MGHHLRLTLFSPRSTLLNAKAQGRQDAAGWENRFQNNGVELWLGEPKIRLIGLNTCSANDSMTGRMETTNEHESGTGETKLILKKEAHKTFRLTIRVSVLQ